MLFFFFLKWNSAHVHQFHFLGQGSVHSGSASWDDWTSIPWWVACELVSLMSFHAKPGQRSKLTPTFFVTCIISVCIRCDMYNISMYKFLVTYDFTVYKVQAWQASWSASCCNWRSPQWTWWPKKRGAAWVPSAPSPWKQHLYPDLSPRRASDRHWPSTRGARLRNTATCFTTCISILSIRGEGTHLFEILIHETFQKHKL